MPAEEDFLNRSINPDDEIRGDTGFTGYLQGKNTLNPDDENGTTYER